jgi:hypothetical protein
VPGWWGLMLVDSEGGLVRRLEQVRAMSRNPDQDPDSVVQLLWRDEAYDELVQRGLHHGLARATRWSLWDTLVEHVDLVELLGVVRARLMARPAWRAS